jgi:hypothetical protein
MPSNNVQALENKVWLIILIQGIKKKYRGTPVKHAEQAPAARLPSEPRPSARKVLHTSNAINQRGKGKKGIVRRFGDTCMMQLVF